MLPTLSNESAATLVLFIAPYFWHVFLSTWSLNHWRTKPFREEEERWCGWCYVLRPRPATKCEDDTLLQCAISSYQSVATFQSCTGIIHWFTVVSPNHAKLPIYAVQTFSSTSHYADLMWGIRGQLRYYYYFIFCLAKTLCTNNLKTASGLNTESKKTFSSMCFLKCFS